ncbi:MAG: FAD-dependent oxidoreductase [Rubrivivax sp.]
MSPTAMSDQVFDIAIVGAGIVGASIACHAAPRARVLLLEAEAAPGCHSTGRSAALFAPSYGPSAVRALTRASRAFFETPPAGFAPVPLLRPRGCLLVGGAAQRGEAEALCATLRAEGSAAELLDADAARALVPVLRPEAAAVALRDPAAFDIDVDALLQGFLRRARAHGAVVATEARVRTLVHDGGRWRIGLADARRYAASIVVDAAGAWADEVAGLAGARSAGVEPRRRSAFLFDPPAGVASADWPAVIALDESWYFKPDAGLLLGSPANADPTHAHDVVAEELDVALGIHRIEQATTMTIRRPRRTWAGLRSFVADGEPVLGFEPGLPAFFWAAALGGYGIQSSPALGALAAAWLRGETAPEPVAAQAGEAELRRWLQPGRT